MMRLFAEDQLLPASGEVCLAGQDAHYARDVLRMRRGDRFILCDAASNDHTCVVERVEARQICARIERVEANHAEAVYDAILYQGIPKGDKLDEIVRKAVELGAARVVPVICDRTISRLGPADRGWQSKLERLRRIAREAARQSGRGRVPAVAAPLVYTEACREAAMAELAFMPWEGERQTPVRDLLASWQSLPTTGGRSGRPRIAFLIGPEGGFALGEVEQAVRAGIRTVSLGRRILRTETAGPAVLAMLTCLLDEFGDAMLYNESPL